MYFVNPDVKSISSVLVLLSYMNGTGISAPLSAYVSMEHSDDPVNLLVGLYELRSEDMI